VKVAADGAAAGIAGKTGKSAAQAEAIIRAGPAVH